MNQQQLIARAVGLPVRRVRESGLPGLTELPGYTAQQLEASFGLSRAAAVRLEALGRLLHTRVHETTPAALRTPEDVSALLCEHAADAVESMWCLPVDVRSQLIGEPIHVSLGDVDGTDAGPRVFFRPALRSGAVGAIAVHNHPSGHTTPSAMDLAVTRRLVVAGNTIDIPLQDHVIIARTGFISLRRDRPDLFAG